MPRMSGMRRTGSFHNLQTERQFDEKTFAVEKLKIEDDVGIQRNKINEFESISSLTDPDNTVGINSKFIIQQVK